MFNFYGGSKGIQKTESFTRVNEKIDFTTSIATNIFSAQKPKFRVFTGIAFIKNKKDAVQISVSYKKH